jgi:hypothetical protein
MAELLVYAKKHWMDNLTPAEVLAMVQANPGFQEKYDSRYQQGDIVEIRPKDYWLHRGFNKKAFVVIKVLGLSVNNKYVESYDSDDIKRRRRWRIRKEDLPQFVITQLKNSGEYTTTKDALLNHFQDKGDV